MPNFEPRIRNGWTVKIELVPTLQEPREMYVARRISGLEAHDDNLARLIDYVNLVKHTSKCKAEVEDRWIEMDEWVERHPDYCRKCKGWGGFESQYDPSPIGVSLGIGSMTDFELCEDCVEQGICPHCGFKFAPDVDIYDFDNMSCPKCGWTEDSEGMVYSSDFYECSCIEIGSQEKQSFG
jgi:hypothetical protein